MPAFQGSGFTIEVPDGCTDASSYAFVLPVNGGYSASLNIRFQSAKTIKDLPAHVNTGLDLLKDSVADFVLLNQVAGKRGANQGVMSQYEWGAGEARVRQKQYCLMTPGRAGRLYVLTSCDLVSNSPKSDPIFNRMMKNFTPNK
jgi:hypothetical protein